MLELDSMLTRFVDRRYGALSSEQQAGFRRLLEAEDDQLWDWLSGRAAPDDTQGLADIVRQIRDCD